MKIEFKAKSSLRSIGEMKSGEVFSHYGHFWSRGNDSDLPGSMCPDRCHYICFRLSDGMLSVLNAGIQVEPVHDAKLVV